MPLTLASSAGVVPLGTIAMVTIGGVGGGVGRRPPGVVPTRGVGTIRWLVARPHATRSRRRTTTIATDGRLARSPSSPSSSSTPPGSAAIPRRARRINGSSSPPARTSPQDRSLRAYSTVGTRGDTDLLLLAQSPTLEDIHTFHVVLAQSGLAKWMSTPHSYLAMTKRSPYSESEARPEICTSERRYLFVYPFDKKREWYRLPPDERQRIMDEHIEVGRRYPEITINTAYSFGLDDQEFVVSFEADDPGSSSTWFRSCGARSRAPTRSGTRRSSPASRCRVAKALDALDGTARRPRAAPPRSPRVPASMSDRSGTAEQPAARGDRRLRPGRLLRRRAPAQAGGRRRRGGRLRPPADPFGLVRAGVAPDHPKIKSVIRVYEKTAARDGFRFFGNVEVGRRRQRAELAERYHAVIYAYGAPTDRQLGIPGEDLPGSHPATAFVAWYNAHPDFADHEFDLSCERAVVIGNGNVATDVARMLALTREELEVTDTADHAIDALADAGSARSSSSAAAAPRRPRSPTPRSASSAR